MMISEYGPLAIGAFVAALLPYPDSDSHCSATRVRSQDSESLQLNRKPVPRRGGGTSGDVESFGNSRCLGDETAVVAALFPSSKQFILRVNNSFCCT